MEKLLLLFILAISLQNGRSASYKPNLLQVAESLNLTSFLKVVNQCGLHKIINHEAYFTVFAPSNEAFAHEKKYPGEDVLCDKVQLHIGRGNVKSNEITNEMTIKSLLSKRTIRLNVYEDNKVVTANGRPVIATDHEARNGVLHVIGEVMSSVYKRQGSIISEIDECCPQHSELVELVKLAGLYGTLDENGPFTLLAPNNGAFAALHPDFINHLKKNRTKLANFLSAHVLSGTLYSAGLEDGMTVKTLAGNKLTVSRRANEDISFGKAGVTLADVTASNGAIHAIDQVIFPTSLQLTSSSKSLNLVQVLQEKGYNSFATALKATKLDKVIDHEGHFTVFAPTDAAFDNPKAYPQDTTLNERVAYYIVRGLIKESMVSDELMVPSLLSKRQLRFNVYKTQEGEEIKTINGQPITFRSFEAHNGIVHELNSGIDYVPPRHGKLHDILANLPQFSAFVQLMDEYHPGLFEHSSSFTMTLLAPTNEVVNEALQSGANAKNLAQTFLLNHIIAESWYTSGLQQTSVLNLGGQSIHLTRVQFENRWPQVFQYLLNDNVTVEIADLTAENGVLHQVNGLIL